MKTLPFDGNESAILKAEIGRLQHAARDRAKPFAAERKKLLSRFDLIKHLHRQFAFSQQTFGPGNRTFENLDHIKKELVEIECDPYDLKEWINLIILALHGAMCRGYSPETVVATLEAVQT